MYKNGMIIFDVLYRDFWGCLLQFSLNSMIIHLVYFQKHFIHSKITNMHVYILYVRLHLPLRCKNLSAEIQ